jgi:tetratricopeptide (TPR) repeat protein
MQLAPLTKSDQLVRDINAVLSNASHYMSPEEFWFRRQVAEAEKLKRADFPLGHNVLAQLWALAGDILQAESHINVALNATENDPSLLLNKGAILSNLGYFSRALQPFKEGADPRFGNFTSRWTLGACIGAFQTLREYWQQATRMNLENISAVDGRLIGRAARVMDEVGLAEEQLSRALDIAGGILREERLFFLGEGAEVSVWDEDALERHLSLNFKLPVPVTTAIQLDEELGHRLFEGSVDLPYRVTIHFESGSPVNEHHAERPAVAG